jgi:hypothetical protein
MSTLAQWADEYRQVLYWLGGVSLATLVISALVLPFLVTRMSADYFLPDRDPSRSFAHRHPVIRWTGLVVKNLFGVVLFVAGILMLALPGQGILTIFIGLMLTDFPGKHHLELWLVRLPAVGKALNWIRKKSRHEPLIIPPREPTPESPAEETQ